jgi:AcrR family transcriptional regulator
VSGSGSYPTLRLVSVERIGQERPAQRRVPAQERSRARVQRILDAAAALVLERGVEALSTRAIAQAAEVPVASLYQYFADKEDVLLALAERDMAEMDEQVAFDVARLESLAVGDFVRTVMAAFVAVYHRRPAFVEIYLRGRTNVAVHRFGRDHNARIAETLRDFALQRGLADERLTPTAALLAVEIGDRVFQLAFEHDAQGDPELLEEGIALMTAYLERFAA